MSDNCPLPPFGASRHMHRFLANFLLCALLSALPSVAAARWHEARSPNFIVYRDGSEAELRQSAALLEDYDRLLRRLTGTSAPPSPAALKVYLVGSAGKLRQIANLPEGAAGRLYGAGGRNGDVRGARRPRPGLGGEEVLLHEYAHHFDDALATPPPIRPGIARGSPNM